MRNWEIWRVKLSIPILEKESKKVRNEKVKRYKSFVENNRRLGQEANAFGNEALGGQQQKMKGKGWRRQRDKMYCL